VKRRSFTVLRTVGVGIFIKTKRKVKGNGQECPFHTSGRPYMSCGDGGETKVPRFARNDNVESASLMATSGAGRRFAARTGERVARPRTSLPSERTAGSSPAFGALGMTNLIRNDNNFPARSE
jgi:hypothetical protein